MELNRMIYQVWEELEGLNITDDTLLDYDYLKDKFIAFHPTLVKEAYDQRLPLDGFYQSISCVEITCEKGSCTIDGIVFPVNKAYFKAILPSLVKTIGSNSIRYFGVDGLSKGLTRVSLDGYRLSDHARFTSSEAIYCLVGDTAIIKNLPTMGMSLATLVGILSDPTKACDWPVGDAQEFPTPSAAKIMYLVKRDILTSVGRPDLVNDSQIALGGGQKKQQASAPEEEPQQ